MARKKKTTGVDVLGVAAALIVGDGLDAEKTEPRFGLGEGNHPAVPVADQGGLDLGPGDDAAPHRPPAVEAPPELRPVLPSSVEVNRARDAGAIHQQCRITCKNVHTSTGKRLDGDLVSLPEAEATRLVELGRATPV